MHYDWRMYYLDLLHKLNVSRSETVIFMILQEVGPWTSKVENNVTLTVRIQIYNTFHFDILIFLYRKK